MAQCSCAKVSCTVSLSIACYICTSHTAVFAANVHIAFPVLLTLTIFAYAEISTIISKSYIIAQHSITLLYL